ncbi:unnamed protein product [Gongylonema pulchrum]|uniref:HTH psq-type domain-containing protein n=1 Tax=Gongylonema pulchrum TaxID=637853 RepID=A0A183DW33_9BILA|nr:unnamed protein product [Gongylonema pulchrum]
MPPTSSVSTAPTSSVQTISGVPTVSDCEAILSQIFTQSGLPLNGAQVAAAAAVAGLPAAAFGLAAAGTGGSSIPKPFSASQANSSYQGTNTTGRRSKYCSAEEKKAVADYAEAHGPSAAGRKFGIPTPVAAYYHRKEYRSKLSYPLPAQMMPPVNAASPGTASGDDLDSTNGDCQNGAVSSSVKCPAGASISSKLPDQQPKLNPAHSTGSPGFLRGRGRGRPKLIGDELDAELVDYMVQVKQSDPRGHLTASQALAIARDYILEKAPGLLEEHGGHIKLKLTWAMKLVTRISERQKEIELGLPAGTISNMTSMLYQCF